jgi:hypothetical protein
VLPQVPVPARLANGNIGETPTRMPHIRAPCLGLDETGQPGTSEQSGAL